MKLYAIVPERGRVELPQNGPEAALPDNAELEIAMEKERDWVIRIFNEGRVRPMLHVSGASCKLGSVGSFAAGKLLISVCDQNGEHYESASYQIRVTSAVKTPAGAQSPKDAEIDITSGPAPKGTETGVPSEEVRELEDQKRQLEHDIAELQSQKKEIEASVALLENQRKRLQDFGEGVRSLDGELKAVEMEYSDKKTQLETQKAELATLRESFANLDKERLSYVTSCRSAQAALDNLKKKHMDATLALQELHEKREQAGMMDAEIEEVEVRMEALREALAERKRRAAVSARRIGQSAGQSRETVRRYHQVLVLARHCRREAQELKEQQEALEQVTGKRLKAIRAKLAEIYEQVQHCENLEAENRENVQLVLQVFDDAERGRIPEILRIAHERRDRLEALERESEEIRAEVFSLVYRRIENR